MASLSQVGNYSSKGHTLKGAFGFYTHLTRYHLILVLEQTSIPLLLWFMQYIICTNHCALYCMDVFLSLFSFFSFFVVVLYQIPVSCLYGLIVCFLLVICSHGFHYDVFLRGWSAACPPVFSHYSPIPLLLLRVSAFLNCLYCTCVSFTFLVVP